jgi:aspartyl/asparaginyl-tRNA synthetase
MTTTPAHAAPAVDIASLAQHIGATVTLQGWVYHLRSSGKVRFLVLRDGSGLAQGVLVKGRLPEEDFQQFERLTLESSLRLEGVVRAEPRAPGGYELEVTRVSPVHIPPATSHPPDSGRGHPGLPGLLPRVGLRPGGHPHPDAHRL